MFIETANNWFIKNNNLTQTNLYKVGSCFALSQSVNICCYGSLRQGSTMLIHGLVLGLLLCNVETVLQNATCPEVTPRELDWKAVSVFVIFFKF